MVGAWIPEIKLVMRIYWWCSADVIFKNIPDELAVSEYISVYIFWLNEQHIQLNVIQADYCIFCVLLGLHWEMSVLLLQAGVCRHTRTYMHTHRTRAHTQIHTDTQ